ncbi:MAG: gluconate 2-dehydrogenase subunit 3 family protein [Heliobacteriaceae bacterium]|nr:gluconate 2-dehydrogenase subunit 3 family protein [Heliobacteriaceae bacterium]MDD4586774.1 gluconate 2-dehydrogenase subunit 3 family protein [Heliobacteriaceae bacterium]
MMVGTVYPGFDVMVQSPHWDRNTRHLIEARLQPPGPAQFFSPPEIALLEAVLGRLLDELDSTLLQRVAGQIDSYLFNNQQNGDHKSGLPPTGDLLRKGLHLLEANAVLLFQRPFLQLTPLEMDELLGKVQRGEVNWQGIPPGEFFRKITGIGIDFFFSQPEIWSEIGFAGPAYPRGYYRLETGLKDPWEPISDPEREDARVAAGLGPARRLE